MGCGCSRPTGANAPVFRAVIVIRAEGSPLACERCLEKHIAKSIVYAAESREDAAREFERALCGANISCAREHADALKDERAKALMDIEGSVKPATPESLANLLGVRLERAEAIGRIAVAEDALRFIGRDDIADRVRAIRVEFMEEKK